jgi:DNA-binding IclR family transcriptional regulator
MTQDTYSKAHRSELPPTSTTARVVQVLLSFSSQSSRLLGVTDISRATGLSKAVTHRILQELESNHLVAQDASTRKYALGSAAFALCDTVSEHSRLRDEGMRVLSLLTARTDETTTLSARMGYRRVYVGQVESSQLIRISVQTGLSLPLTVGASGHAMLAFLPDPDIETVLNQPVPALNERTETRVDQLRKRLTVVRERGFARTDSERVEESVSFAAPIFGPTREVIGSISIAALASRVDGAREVILGDEVVAAAAQLSRRLSHRSGADPSTVEA